MARIRTIKPEFWSDEKLAPLDSTTRLVFLGLVSHADDAGRLVDSVRTLNGLIFPFTDEDCLPALARLAEIGVIQRGKTSSGQPVIQLVGWDRHQRIDRPNLSACLPPISGKSLSRKAKLSTKPRRSLDETSSKDRRTFDEASTKDRRSLDEDSSTRVRSTIRSMYGGGRDTGSKLSSDAHARSGAHAHTREGGEPDELATWLGQYATVLDDCPLVKHPRTRRTLFQHYGPPGLRANAWQLETGSSVDEAERPRLLALALSGYAGEGNKTIVTNEFAGMVRKIVAKEAKAPRSSTPNGDPPRYHLTAAEVREIYGS